MVECGCGLWGWGSSYSRGGRSPGEFLAPCQASIPLTCVLPLCCGLLLQASRYLMLFVTFLPFAFWPLFGWVTIPIMAAFTFLLVGLENIGTWPQSRSQLEEHACIALRLDLRLVVGCCT